MAVPDTPQDSKHTGRPLGVWLATIWAGLFAGLMPFGLLQLFYFGPAKGWELIAVWQFLLSGALSAGIIVSALLAWRGSSAARYALAVLVLIHYGLITYQNFNMAIEGLEVRGSSAALWGRVIRSPITAIVIAGYLLFSPRANSFFRSRSISPLTR
jgi:hypothetical protein